MVASADVIPLSVFFQTPSAGEAVVVCGVNITDVTDQDKLHEMVSRTTFCGPRSVTPPVASLSNATIFSSVPTKHTSRVVSNAILSPQSSCLILNDSFYRFCLQAFNFTRRLSPAPPRHGTGDSLRPPVVNRLSPARVFFAPPPPGASPLFSTWPLRACTPSPTVTNRHQPSPAVTTGS